MYVMYVQAHSFDAGNYSCVTEVQALTRTETCHWNFTLTVYTRMSESESPPRLYQAFPSYISTISHQEGISLQLANYACEIDHEYYVIKQFIRY